MKNTLKLCLILAIFPFVAGFLSGCGSSGAIGNAKIDEMRSNGKNLYTSVFADALDANTIGFPALGDYKTSTDYFKTLAGQRPTPKGETAIAIPAGPDYFAAYKPPAKSWEDCTAANVGWCVVTGKNEATDATTPIFFTDNLLSENFPEESGVPAADAEVKINPDTPLGTKVVVAFHGGGVNVLDSASPDFWAQFNDAQTPFSSAAVIRP